MFFRVSYEDVDYIKPTRPYEQPKAIKSRNWNTKHEIVPGKRYSEYDLDKSSEKLRLLPQEKELAQYNPDPMIEKILTHGNEFTTII